MNAKVDDSELMIILKRLDRNSRQPFIDPIVERWANNVVATAKSLAPVKTGRLKNSIKSRIFRTKVEIKANVSYAIFVEFGTIKMKAQPFFYPAIDAHEKELKRSLEKSLIKGIKK